MRGRPGAGPDPEGKEPRLAEPLPTPEPLDPALRDRVFAFALRLTGDRSLADDVAQETMVRVLAAPVPRDLPYLLRIALNLVRTEARRSTRRRAAPGDLLEAVADGRTPGPLEALEKREEKERTWRSLGLLPEKERIALNMRMGEKYSCGEIAAVLGITPNAVSCLLRRGRDRLAAILDPRSEPR